MHNVIGGVHRRCMGDNKWDEYIECFREEAKMLFDQVYLRKLILIVVNRCFQWNHFRLKIYPHQLTS